MADAVEQKDIRGINVESSIKGFVLEKMKLKQICSVETSSNWQEDYYQEGSAQLTGGTGHAIEGVPRLAEFPYLEPSWTKQSSYHVKHAGTTIVSYEDELGNAFDTVKRSIIRVGNAVAYSVDRAIYSAITSDANVNTHAITAGWEWDSATTAQRQPIEDFFRGIEEMMIDNYDFLENGFILLSPTDYAHVMGNSKVVNNPSFKTADVVSNGIVGQVAGGKIIVSNAVDADEAAMVIGQMAVTYKVLDPLKASIENHPGIKKVISAWEIGITQIVHPEAIHIITNTQA